MRILYGVVGEGMGHATRSKVVCEHLVSKGHSIKIVVSGRAHAFLSKSFPDVVEIRGLTIRYVDNAVDRDGSLARNVLAAPEMLFENVSKYYENVVRYRPDVTITDFDSFAYLFAKRHNVPVISIDNQQIISRTKLGKFAKKGVKLDYQLTKAFVRAKLPLCDHYFITSFFTPPVRRKYSATTTLVPPILRSAILQAKRHSRFGDHVVVYQTSTSDRTLLPSLQRVKGVRFIVYGLGKSAALGNCTLKEFSDDGFAHDLASAKAIVTNGGYSLLGEALYLGKPIYSVPVRHQFEQILNARYLEELGYGLAADAIDADILSLFLREQGKYAARVATHQQDGNTVLFQKLDELLSCIKKKKVPSRNKNRQELG